MNDPHSQPAGYTPKKESGFLFGDWNLPEEKAPNDCTPLFDGKIIARMPDLGSVSIAKTLEKSIVPSFWGYVRATISPVAQGGTPNTAVARQRFFHRVISFGGIVILCGIGILLLNPEKNKISENTFDLTEISLGTSGTSVTKPTVSPFSPVMQAPFAHSETSNVMPGFAVNAAIPVAPVESVTAVSPHSPWDRPVAESPASWEYSPKPPADPFQPNNAAIADTVPSGLSDTVVMSPMTPIATASVPVSPHGMPVSPHEMPVSPYEIQLIAQSNQHTVPSGMMPMHGRQEYSPGMAQQQNTQWQTPVPQQFPPAAPGYAQSNYPYGQAGQGQYAVPPNYMSPPQKAIPTSVPIPSGASTLPPQGGQYGQPYGVPIQSVQPLGTPPMQRPPSDFYNPPPTSRWM